jgi:hypothetical protein
MLRLEKSISVFTLKATWFLCLTAVSMPLSVQEMLTRVMKSDDRIRYATVCDMEGQVLGTEIQEGLKPLLNEEEHKEALVYAVNSMKVRQKLSAKLGKNQYVLAVYDNLCRLTMPIGNKYMLLLTWGPETSLDIIKNIRDALK